MVYPSRLVFRAILPLIGGLVSMVGIAGHGFAHEIQLTDFTPTKTNGYFFSGAQNVLSHDLLI